MKNIGSLRHEYDNFQTKFNSGETDWAGFCGTHLPNKICAILCPEIIAGKLLDCVKEFSNGSKLQCIPLCVMMCTWWLTVLTEEQAPGFNILWQWFVSIVIANMCSSHSWRHSHFKLVFSRFCRQLAFSDIKRRQSKMFWDILNFL